FRVVIVGAGPTGLAIAHCLSAAGKELVVLERRGSIVQETGASLGLWPQSVRLLHQLQLLDAARHISEPLKLSYHFDQDGKEISKMIEKRHGYPFMLFERMRFVEMLYENLPGQSRVKTCKYVVGVEQNKEGVKVQLDDGTCKRGDIVIGADSVHSFVRGQM
ncbi:FAD/NAD(P)-binding domain-containing protein, partial [Tothia fuscella]